MTASGVQSTIGRGRRIIERPRLIKLLDETDARTILLLAPAGYGKTTLARQWLKSMSRCITLSLTPSDRDVLWLAEEIARRLEPLKGGAARGVREHILAAPSSDKAPAMLARALSESLVLAEVQWLFLDNYEVLTGSLESEQLVELMAGHPSVGLLVASRIRPAWASSRQAIYGEIYEIPRDELAMTNDEVAKVVGRKPGAARIASQAQGWAAVVGLAATVEGELEIPTKLPEALHRYLAEELFYRVPPSLRDDLFSLALFGPDARKPLPAEADESVRAMDALGFGSVGDNQFELHPLIEEFLLDKLLEEPNGADRVRAAIHACLTECRWERALMLVGRFDVQDLIDTAVRAAFKPLVRTGRITPLAALTAKMRNRGELPPAAADLVAAEVAMGNGDLDLAEHLAQRAETRMEPIDPLTSRAAGIRGQCLHLKADLDASYRAFEAAYARAQDEHDRSEALNGLTFTTIFNEQPNAPEAVAAMHERRNRSVTSFLRYATADITYRLLGGPGYRAIPTETIRHAWDQCDDPRARTAITFNVAYALAISAEHGLADEWMGLFFEDVERFHLEFTMPLASWVVARIAIGKRRFAEAERALRAVEEATARTHEHRHQVSAATLRGRLLLQTGDVEAALAATSIDIPEPLFPSWRGEFLATRALVLAVSGRTCEARDVAARATRATVSHDARIFARVATAIADPSDKTARASLISAATELNVWDPVLCGVRASTAFADALCEPGETRSTMGALYQRTQDWPLARRGGFRVRATRAAHELLTPRELEVLELIAQGLTNHDISRALFISDSTTKVHVRHILEKLGVRTRAEAVAHHRDGLNPPKREPLQAPATQHGRARKRRA